SYVLFLLRQSTTTHCYTLSLHDALPILLRRAGELWMQHRAEIKDWIVREAGSVPAKAALETDTASGICYEASALPTHPQGEVLRSEEHTSELQSRFDLVCRLLLEKKKNQ